MAHDVGMGPQDLIGSAEAARIIGCSQTTVGRLVEAGTLPVAVTAPGGAAGIRLFYRRDVERVAQERAAEKRPARAAS